MKTGAGHPKNRNADSLVTDAAMTRKHQRMGKMTPRYTHINADQAELARIGKRIREVRQLARMSQKELAQAIEYAQSNTISKIELGLVSSLDLLVLRKIAKATNVSFHYLTDGMDGVKEKREPWAILLAYQSKQIRLLEQILQLLSRGIQR